MLVHIFLGFYVQNFNLYIPIILMVAYHLLIILFIWSWLRTVFTPSASCNENFRLNSTEQYHLNSLQTSHDRDAYLLALIEERDLQVNQRINTNRSVGADTIRYCRKSGALKPDRAHYDSMTKELVLKMDHYCPWVANCIGYSNYKFFVLFLFYAISYCLFIIGTTIAPFIQVWSGNDVEGYKESGFRLQLILVFLVASVFSVSLVFLFGLHFYLISKNRTTIELYGSPVISSVGQYKDAFNLSCMQNWQQVCGKSCWQWFIPIKINPPECDNGHCFPLNDKIFIRHV